MDGTHIAFITIPHSPHVNPTIPIAATLVRRGYYVTYVTSDRFSQSVENYGAKVVVCEKLLQGGLPAGQSAEKDPIDIGFNYYARRMLGDVTPFFEKNRPNLILYDSLAFAGRILAKRWRIPAIQTSPVYAFGEGSFESQLKHKGLQKLAVEYIRIVNQFLQRYDVPSSNYLVDKERLNIYLFPRVLQPNGNAFGDCCFFAGRCAAERLSGGQWQENADGRPIALISMSTLLSTWGGDVRIPEYYRMCIDALPGLGWHVVLAIGENCKAGSLMPLPAHCEVIQHASYLKALSRAKLLVFMSGTVSTAEAAYHGVPMIAMTEGVGEYEWQADHLAELGIGAHISKADTNPERIGLLATRMSEDEAIQRRVKEIQRAVRREPGAEDAANRIEEYLEESG